MTISAECQIVIPSTIRSSVDIGPDRKLWVITYDNRTEMIPVRPLEETRGFLKGIDTSIECESDRI